MLKPLNSFTMNKVGFAKAMTAKKERDAQFLPDTIDFDDNDILTIKGRTTITRTDKDDKQYEVPAYVVGKKVGNQWKGAIVDARSFEEKSPILSSGKLTERPALPNWDDLADDSTFKVHVVKGVVSRPDGTLGRRLMTYHYYTLT